jgi:hypothetical protein
MSMAEETFQQNQRSIMNPVQPIAIVILALVILPYRAVAQGNASRGERMYRACVACHMTGPSLADLWSRQAGSLSSFPRYSAALKSLVSTFCESRGFPSRREASIKLFEANFGRSGRMSTTRSVFAALSQTLPLDRFAQGNRF